MTQIEYKPKNALYPNPQGKDDLWYGYQPRLNKPKSIVIHSTNNGHGNTSFASEEKFLYETKVVAADYLVGATQITQFLDSAKYYAWHAGAVNDSLYANHNSIGIETHYSPADKNPFDVRIKDNLTTLVKDIMKTYSIPAEHIELHRRVAVPKGRKSDPNWMTDTDFYIWRDSLKDNLQHYWVVSHSAPIYTAPNKNAPISLSGKGFMGYMNELDGIDQGNGFIWHSTGVGFLSTSDVTNRKPT
jgi:N-acetyl-anhydromuramyl-L-alanine amidase AmpD